MDGEASSKCRRNVDVNAIALSDVTGTAELHIPLIEGQAVLGCSTIAPEAAASYLTQQIIEVRTDLLDNVYRGQVGFVKIDVEGPALAVLPGPRANIRRRHPRLL